MVKMTHGAFNLKPGKSELAFQLEAWLSELVPLRQGKQQAEQYATDQRFEQQVTPGCVWVYDIYIYHHHLSTTHIYIYIIIYQQHASFGFFVLICYL